MPAVCHPLWKESLFSAVKRKPVLALLQLNWAPLVTWKHSSWFDFLAGDSLTYRSPSCLCQGPIKDSEMNNSALRLLNHHDYWTAEMDFSALLLNWLCLELTCFLYVWYTAYLLMKAGCVNVTFAWMGCILKRAVGVTWEVKSTYSKLVKTFQHGHSL